MKVILYTCVLAELQKSKSDPQVVEYINQVNDGDLFLSVITIGEITKGISLLNKSKKKNRLIQWLVTIEQVFGKRILPIDSETVQFWGELTANAQKKGIIIPAADGLIAATALQHGLHLITRNKSDFSNTGALVINPWK
jgi:predicted nucleic acid-binding protein